MKKKDCMAVCSFPSIALSLVLFIPFSAIFIIFFCPCSMSLVYFSDLTSSVSVYGSSLPRLRRVYVAQSVLGMMRSLTNDLRKHSPRVSYTVEHCPTRYRR